MPSIFNKILAPLRKNSLQHLLANMGHMVFENVLKLFVGFFVSLWVGRQACRRLVWQPKPSISTSSNTIWAHTQFENLGLPPGLPKFGFAAMAANAMSLIFCFKVHDFRVPRFSDSNAQFGLSDSLISLWVLFLGRINAYWPRRTRQTNWR